MTSPRRCSTPSPNKLSDTRTKTWFFFSRLDEFKRVSKEEITLLPESQRVVNFDLPKTVRLPPILPMLLMPPICNHVFLRDTKGDVMGRKGDFRVNWPVNRKGMPVDLAKQLHKTARDENFESTGEHIAGVIFSIDVKDVRYFISRSCRADFSFE